MRTAAGVILLLSALVRRLPLAWVLGFARAMGWLWFYVLPVRRGVALANVARVYGSSISRARQRQIVRGSFVNTCMVVMESLRLPSLTPALSAQLVAPEGLAQVDAALARGRGVIVVSAHMGNFDLCGASQAIRGYPVHVVAKTIHWPPAQRFIRRVREATGIGLVPPKNSRAQICRLLAANQIVAFFVDQHLPPHRAIVCDFLGHPAATTPAPARLALETGAAVVPVLLVRDRRDGYHRLIVEPEFKLTAPHATQEANLRHNTERLNALVGGWVRAWPEQWLWAHRRWKLTSPRVSR